MHWLSLPEPRKNITPAFSDNASARAWLATQPQAQPAHMLAALLLQVEAIDAAAYTVAQSLELLNLLRSVAVPALASIEARFTRKALPMPEDDQRCFDLSWQLWLRLGVAYLRLAPNLPPASRGLPLNRAAAALRMADYCHFLAARESPTILAHLLFGVLAEAASHELLLQALPDPDFPNLGEANIAGHLAWAFLLRLIDPYRLSATQLAVTQRALSRWRELAAFQAAQDNDPKALTVDLSLMFGAPLPEGIPRWFNVRAVARKLRQRIEALKLGESPESLKLGRELSAAACIRLLKMLDASLRPHRQTPTTEIGEIEIAFGAEHAYAVLKGEFLNPVGGMGAASTYIAHQRMEMFGFDRASQLPNAVKKLKVPGEQWSMVDGHTLRAADQAGSRRLSPCLIAATRQGKPCLGVMLGLKSMANGALAASLAWYEGRLEAGWLKNLAPPDLRTPKTPAFLLQAHDSLSLVLPANALVKLGSALALEGISREQVVPGEVLERGVDFVRYAVNEA